MARIAVLDDYQDVAQTFADWDRLRAEHEVVFLHEPLGGLDAVAGALAEFEIVCLMRERTPFPAALLERLPKLELLVTTGMRNAAVDVEAASTRGVTVCGTEFVGHGTAELTWALILAVARHLPTEARAIREGGWQTTVGTALHGKTLGVLGLGRLGSVVARIGVAFGMRVIAWSENLTEARAAEVGVVRVARETLLRDSDVLTIHLVLSERTRGLLGRRELELMKRTAFLVNTSRGPIVDEVALVDALENGGIAGAGLDVFDKEPLPPAHPLRTLANVVLTPHVGYVTDDCYRLFYEQTVEDVEAFLSGRPLRVLTA